jgi:curved DNA-binding protein CbpA
LRRFWENRLKASNHYEFLQISSNAEPDTIHRVFRFLAARFHPDNPETGDANKFHELKQAYDVLSDPKLRAEYDAGFATNPVEPDPLSNSLDFMDDMDGELNRRLAVLALLYIRRRSHPDSPGVTLYEVEKRMGFPRDYLEFTLWYLQRKGYIARADNAAFTLMAEGVDFVEQQRATLPVLNKLLTTGTEASSRDPQDAQETPETQKAENESGPTPIYSRRERRKPGDRRKRA